MKLNPKWGGGDHNIAQNDRISLPDIKGPPLISRIFNQLPVFQPR